MTPYLMQCQERQPKQHQRPHHIRQPRESQPFLFVRYGPESEVEINIVLEESEFSAALRFDIAAARMAAIKRPEIPCGMRVTMNWDRCGPTCRRPKPEADNRQTASRPRAGTTRTESKSPPPLDTNARADWRWFRAVSSRCTMS